MIACIIFIIILIIANVTIIVPLIIIIRLFVIGLKTSLLLILALGTEARLSFTHLVELGIIFIGIIFEDFILLILEMLVLELFNDFLLLGTPLAIL